MAKDHKRSKVSKTKLVKELVEVANEQTKLLKKTRDELKRLHRTNEALEGQIRGLQFQLNELDNLIKPIAEQVNVMSDDVLALLEHQGLVPVNSAEGAGPLSPREAADAGEEDSEVNSGEKDSEVNVNSDRESRQKRGRSSSSSGSSTSGSNSSGSDSSDSDSSGSPRPRRQSRFEKESRSSRSPRSSRSSTRSRASRPSRSPTVTSDKDEVIVDEDKNDDSVKVTMTIPRAEKDEQEPGTLPSSTTNEGSKGKLDPKYKIPKKATQPPPSQGQKKEAKTVENTPAKKKKPSASNHHQRTIYTLLEDDLKKPKCTFCAHHHFSDICPTHISVDARIALLESSNRCHCCLQVKSANEVNHTCKNPEKSCWHCHQKGHHAAICKSATTVVHYTAPPNSIKKGAPANQGSQAQGQGQPDNGQSHSTQRGRKRRDEDQTQGDQPQAPKRR